jgi:hypothetical protein
MDVTLLMPDLADNGARLTNCPAASRPSLKVRLPVSIATTSGRPTCHSKTLLDRDHPFTRRDRRAEGLEQRSPDHATLAPRVANGRQT